MRSFLRARAPTFAALLALAIPTPFGSAAPATSAAAHTWWNSRDGSPATYRFSDVTIILSDGGGLGVDGPRLQAVANNGATIALPGSDESDHKFAVFKVLRLDPEHSSVDVVFATDTGGAHCCADIRVLSLIGGNWQIEDMGSWDGGPEQINDQPIDLIGDGKFEFVRGDDRFLYTFCGYADCEVPQQFLRIEDGIVLDVSAQRGFRESHRKDMVKHQRKCAEGDNGACAAFVASAVRAGLFDWAWQFMLKHYSRQNKRGLKMSETEYGERCCPPEFNDFPSALKWFLRDTGYLDVHQR